MDIIHSKIKCLAGWMKYPDCGDFATSAIRGVRAPAQ
jgi:hypothetical protein